MRAVIRHQRFVADAVAIAPGTVHSSPNPDPASHRVQMSAPRALTLPRSIAGARVWQLSHHRKVHR